MKTLNLEQYGLSELSIEDQLSINGEYSWNEFCNDVGYGVGSCVAYATNAADIIANELKNQMVTLGVDRALRK